MRRKPGTLLSLEVDILEAGLELRRAGGTRFHGFQLAKAIADHAGPRPLTSHGTLYKALQRLEEAGLLQSQWEDPNIAAAEGRPRRRLYAVTGAGERALAAWQTKHRRAARRPGLEPT
jgi:DNA-binding PadR family transcriptional regulator